MIAVLSVPCLLRSETARLQQLNQNLAQSKRALQEALAGQAKVLQSRVGAPALEELVGVRSDGVAIGAAREAGERPGAAGTGGVADRAWNAPLPAVNGAATPRAAAAGPDPAGRPAAGASAGFGSGGGGQRLEVSGIREDWEDSRGGVGAMGVSARDAPAGVASASTPREQEGLSQGASATQAAPAGTALSWMEAAAEARQALARGSLAQRLLGAGPRAPSDGVNAGVPESRGYAPASRAFGQPVGAPSLTSSAPGVAAGTGSYADQYATTQAGAGGSYVAAYDARRDTGAPPGVGVRHVSVHGSVPAPSTASPLAANGDRPGAQAGATSGRPVASSGLDWVDAVPHSGPETAGLASRGPVSAHWGSQPPSSVRSGDEGWARHTGVAPGAAAASAAAAPGPSAWSTYSAEGAALRVMGQEERGPRAAASGPVTRAQGTPTASSMSLPASPNRVVATGRPR